MVRVVRPAWALLVHGPRRCLWKVFDLRGQVLEVEPWTGTAARTAYQVPSVKRFTEMVVVAREAFERCSDDEVAEYLATLATNAIKPPVNTDGRSWIVMYQGNTADEMRALAASLLIAADQLEDAQAKPAVTPVTRFAYCPDGPACGVCKP